MHGNSDYSDEIAIRICSYLAQGESLRSVCQREGMPARSAVFVWLKKYPEFLKLYTIAKEESADALIEDMLDIADHESTEKGAVNRDRLKVDTRKWIAAKLKPKKYGDKIDHQVTGADGGPIVHKVELVALVPNDSGTGTASS